YCTDKAPRTTADVANSLTSDISSFAHHPAKALVHIMAQPLVERACDWILVAAVDCVKFRRDAVPVFRHLPGFILNHCSPKCLDRRTARHWRGRCFENL